MGEERRDTPLLSLAYLTGHMLSPPDAVVTAAELGYDAIGLRALPAAPGGTFSPLIEDRALLAETVRRVRETGISVFDVEIVRLASDFSPKTVEPFLDVCGELGAKAVLVAGDDPDEARLTASFARFCEAAAPYGLTGNLEFMPWTKVPDVKTALRIVERAGRANGCVLVDALHVARSATTLADLAAIPAGRQTYAQICDAPAEIPDSDEGLIFTARCERRLPGEGGIDLVSMFSALPADLPVSVEIPNDARMPVVGAREWARQALEATKALLKRRMNPLASPQG
jgi:sugar phosphate isomerase/epimerase